MGIADHYEHALVFVVFVLVIILDDFAARFEFHFFVFTIRRLELDFIVFQLLLAIFDFVNGFRRCGFPIRETLLQRLLDLLR